MSEEQNKYVPKHADMIGEREHARFMVLRAIAFLCGDKMLITRCKGEIAELAAALTAIDAGRLAEYRP